MNPLIERHQEYMAIREANRKDWDHQEFADTMMQLIFAAHKDLRDEYHEYAEQELIVGLAKKGITLTITEEDDEPTD